MLDMLKGVKVVSFNHFLMGPMGIQVLGDLGADVVSIETPEGAYQRHWSAGNIWCDGQSVLHLCANRNKRNIALDLKSEKGKEIALRLIDGADVVAENFRPGVMDKLGFGYEALKARKPSLIYASASGYGPDGPYKERPGQDLLAQALFGLMAITGQQASGPRPVGVSAVDHHGAAVFAMGVLAALVRRGRTGQGCRVDVSLMQAALDLQAESLVGWLNSEKKPDERSPRHIAAWYYSAPYGVYATRDGHIAISITPLKLLSEALEDPRLLRFGLEETWDPARKEAICDLIAETIRTRDTDHWISRMQPLKIWHARVQGYADIVADPQVQHMKCIVTAPGAGKDGKPVTLVNHPVRYDGQAAEVRLPPQPLGGQTEDVLSELGFGAAEIEALERDGVVRRAQ